jgi:lipopolysaccharide/colanic/teichoic acid biosynthesis glycosyltransferase
MSRAREIDGWAERELSEIGPSTIAEIEALSGPRLERGQRALKRAVDVVLSGFVLILLSPVMAVIAVTVRLASPGPALFRQVRVGRLASPFVMYKFRTMYDGIDDSVHREYVTSMLTQPECPDGGEPGVYKLSNDPRVTRVGAFLRRSSLDELPQLFNVLRGDMSLVGPRPSLPWEVELYPPEYRIRFTVKPGITGLWQVRGRSTLTTSQALEFDAEYVRRVTFWMDLTILLRTIPVAFTGHGAR